MPKMAIPIERCEEILEQAEFGFLAMSRDGQPYCLPFNFVYDKGKIYIHTGLKGTKHEYIKGNPKVCFTVALPGDKLTGESPCQYSYRFESVALFGNARYVEKPSELTEALALLIDKYREAPVTAVPEDKLAKLKMLRIDIDQITSRQNV